MTKVEVVGKACEEEQLDADGAAVCADGGRVYAGADDGKVKVYDATTLKLVQQVAAHEYAISDLLVLGASLFTGSADCCVKVWDALTLTPRTTTPPHEDAVRKLGTNGVRVFAGDDKGDVRLYDVDGQCKGAHSLMEEVWGLHAEGDHLYTVRDRGITVFQLYESNKSSVLTSVEGRAPMAVAGQFLVCGDASGMNLIVRENKLPKMKELGELKGHTMIITALVGCGEGRAASSGYDNTVKIWDLVTLKEIASCDIPACATSLCYLKDSGCLFVTGSGGYVCKLKIS